MSITSTRYRRKLSNLVKIYIIMIKYSSRNNSFTFKLVFFHNICLKVDFSSKTKMKIFLIIFKDLALNYYYLNISTSTVTINFNQVCYFIRN